MMKSETLPARFTGARVVAGRGAPATAPKRAGRIGRFGGPPEGYFSGVGERLEYASGQAPDDEFAQGSRTAPDDEPDQGSGGSPDAGAPGGGGNQGSGRAPDGAPGHGPPD
ncbi:MAG TPA: hypothetical protein VIC85_14775 [Ktedonobacterales bacterium]